MSGDKLEKSSRAKHVTVADICALMEQWAPLDLAENWDNPGLQVGDPHWTVKTIWVALDPLGDLILAAAENHVDLIITHHPLIFKPLKQLNPATAPGSDIQVALCSQIAIYSAHTNLDSTTGGVNDILAQHLGLTCTGPLQVPADRGGGIGRVGYFDREVTLDDLARRIKRQFKLKVLKYAGDRNLAVKRAAICSGSGSSLMQMFFKSQAQVYISGDLHYHDARMAEQQGRAVIDMGHFASEQIVVSEVARKINAHASRQGWDVRAVVTDLEVDPFIYL